MTEFMGNITEQPVEISVTLEPEGDVHFLSVVVTNSVGRTIDDWTTDDPDEIDTWFQDNAEARAKWMAVYHGGEPGGHIAPLGPGNSNSGTR